MFDKDGFYKENDLEALQIFDEYFWDLQTSFYSPTKYFMSLDGMECFIHSYYIDHDVKKRKKEAIIRPKSKKSYWDLKDKEKEAADKILFQLSYYYSIIKCISYISFGENFYYKIILI